MIPKKIYIIDYQLEQCDRDGIADARINARPFRGANGKLVEYLCPDSLWHPMSEKPKIGSEILIQRNLEAYRGTGVNANKTFTHEVDYHDDWNFYAKDEKYLRWFYIEDLIKGE